MRKVKIITNNLILWRNFDLKIGITTNENELILTPFGAQLSEHFFALVFVSRALIPMNTGFRGI